MKKLSIIIPVHNEEAILESEMRALVGTLQNVIPEVNYELLLVENGSTDGTNVILDRLGREYSFIRTLHLPKASYGLALKQGIMMAEGEYSIVFNVDFWNVEFLQQALTCAKTKAPDVVVGSKNMPGSTDTRAFVRRMLTKLFNLFLNFWFDFHGTDTHGMKLFKTKKVAALIPECITNKEIFDTELMLRCAGAGYTMVEIPVRCEEKRPTKMKLLDRVPRTLRDILVLSWSLRYSVLNYKVILTFIIGVVLIWSTSDLTSTPAFWFDEGTIAGPARNIAEHGVYGMMTAPEEFHTANYWISVGYPVVFPTALVIKLFGIGVLQARLVPIIYLVLFILISFILVRQMYGNRAALLGVVLLVTFSPLYGNGKALLGEIPALFWLLLGGFTYLRFEKTLNKKHLYLASFFWGLAVVTKIPLVLFVPGFIYILAVLFRKQFINLSTIFFSLANLAVPILLWAFFAFDWANVWTVNPFSYFFNAYASDSFTPLIVQNLFRFVSESTPIHFALISLPMVVVVIRSRLRGEALHPLLVALGVYFVLTFLWYLKTPGWYRYFFPIHILSILFLPFALERLIPKRTIFTICISALVLVQISHLAYTYYNNSSSKEPEHVARFLNAEMRSEQSVFVASKPEISFLLTSSRLSQFIFINKNLIIGRSEFPSTSTDYIVSGRNEDSFVVENEEILRDNYYLLREIGHYRIYKSKQI